jgi:threonyl-tRNA synthetase
MDQLTEFRESWKSDNQVLITERGNVYTIRRVAGAYEVRWSPSGTTLKSETLVYESRLRTMHQAMAVVADNVMEGPLGNWARQEVPG